jgi:LmbE family N-acetylglucosaminyl deacetylase
LSDTSDATGHAAANACAAVGCRFVEAPIWMWHWARPDDKRVPWQRLAALPIEPPALLRKQAALAAHTSQLEPRSDALGPVLDPLICALAGRACEYFLV